MRLARRSSTALRLPVLLAIVLLLALTILPLAHSAQQETENPAAAAFREAKWIKGPTSLPLQRVAEITLPEKHAAVQGTDARRISEAMHNPTASDDFALIFAPSGDWFARFQFENAGYVKDDEKDSLDATAMLDSIKQGTEAANKERAKRGWPPLTIIGWETRPHYDGTTHHLSWAIRGESEGRPIINYNTRLLGRNGIMHAKLVTGPETYAQALSEFQALLTGYSFTKGNRYAEWVQGDKVAAVGLTALVTGGAAAVAVKSGFAKYLWKILLVAGAGSLAFVRKLFKRDAA